MSARRMLREAERIFWVAASIGFVIWAGCALWYFWSLAAGMTPPGVVRVGSNVIGLSSGLCGVIAAVFRVEIHFSDLRRDLRKTHRIEALTAPSWVPRVIINNEDISEELTRAAMERATRDYARERDGSAA